jgi:UMF1 family MFS transporter
MGRSGGMGAAPVPAGTTTSTMSDEERSRAQRGYMMYDWAKSGFETSVVVAVLPAWFAYLFIAANGQEITVAGMTQTADGIFALVTASAALLVAIVSPGLGVIADRIPIKQLMLRWATIVASGATVLLGAALFLPIEARWVWLAIMYLIANIGTNVGNVYYNVLLPHICKDEEELDRISTGAYMYGYVGGGLLLAIHLGLVVGTGYADWATAFALSTTGLWFIGFATYTFRRVPEPPIAIELEGELTLGSATKLAISEVKGTIGEFFGTYRILGLYLLAYLLFIDGINAVTGLAGAYGAGVLGVPLVANMAVILLVQFVAFPSAAFFIKVASWTSTKTTVMITCSLWVFVVLMAIAFAPLPLDAHEDHDFMANDNGDGTWTIVNATDLEIGPAGSDQAFREATDGLLPYEEYNPTKDVMEFNGTGRVVSEAQIGALLDVLSTSRFSMSVQNGSHEGFHAGDDHPTSLGDGPIDVIPMTARRLIWEPLNMGISVQWMFIGIGAGFLLGGSQGMARSLFCQMVPESRSAEFFGFIGFFGRAASFIGPALYFSVSGLADARTAILSILMLIVVGVILTWFVDVETASEIAKAEDAKYAAQAGESK